MEKLPTIYVNVLELTREKGAITVVYNTMAKKISSANKITTLISLSPERLRVLMDGGDCRDRLVLRPR